MPEEKSVSILAAIREDWKKAGSKTPDKKASEALISTWKKNQAEVEKLEASLEKAKDSLYASVKDLAKAYGAQSLRIDGVIHDFATKGERVFFRRKNTDVVSI